MTVPILIPRTVSCSRVYQIETDRPHCGECTQCLRRRFAIISALASSSTIPRTGTASGCSWMSDAEGTRRALAVSYIELAEGTRRRQCF